MEKPIILRIKKIKKETPLIKTFTFDYDLKSKPGQFIMLWIPRVDQIPLSISRQNKKSFEITVMMMGEGTKKLFALRSGDKIGISGPYGRGFSIKPKSKIILVGGGCGSAPLRFLAEEAERKKCSITFITGAKTKKEVLFKKVLPGSCLVSTNDGSEGHKGFTTDILEKKILEKGSKFNKIYTCGPEIMMKKIVDMCYKYRVPCEVSLERYMKCGFGLCGQCSVDPDGICICQEGPVFSGDRVRKITEFGNYFRDKAGVKHKFN
jgi:dihydroorotate dehydrogenase electron transfer subunit